MSGAIKRVMAFGALAALAVALYQAWLSVYVSLASGASGLSGLALVLNVALHSGPALVVALVLFTIVCRHAPSDACVSKATGETRLGDLAFWLGLAGVAITIVLAGVAVRAGMIWTTSRDPFVAPLAFFIVYGVLLGIAALVSAVGLALALRARRLSEKGTWISILSTSTGLVITLALATQVLSAG